jgi:hypothetical protein
MKFFIPLAKDEAMAEDVLRSTAKVVERPVPPPAERIFRFAYRDQRIAPGKITTVQVGDPIDPYYKEVGPVIAIFGGDPLLVCMRDRGVARGAPIMVGANEVVNGSVEYFDEESGKTGSARILITPSVNGVPARSLSLSVVDVKAALASGDDAAAGGLTPDGAVHDAVRRIMAGSEHPVICEALLWAACRRDTGVAEHAVAGGVEIKIDLTERESGRFDCRYEVLALNTTG